MEDDGMMLLVIRLFHGLLLLDVRAITYVVLRVLTGRKRQEQRTHLPWKLHLPSP